MNTLSLFFILSGFIIIVGLFLFLYIKNRLDKFLTRENLYRLLSQDFEAILIEINQATDRNIAILEDKMLQLKESLDAADTRLKLLKQSENIRPQSEEIYLKLKKEGIRRDTETTGEKIRETMASEKKNKEDSDIQNQVLTMARQGIALDLIASKTGIPLGEVELIISLQSL